MILLYDCKVISSFETSFWYFSPSLMLFQGCERKGKRRLVMETINCSIKKIEITTWFVCLILLFCWRMVKFALPLTRIIQIGCLRSIWPIGRQRTGDPLRVSPICHHMDSQSVLSTDEIDMCYSLWCSSAWRDEAQSNRPPFVKRVGWWPKK